MTLSIIVAIARNGVIGREGALPWRLPADLRRFKRLTMGHHLLMGRKTFDSIGRPLPGRQNVVITRNERFEQAGVQVAPSFESALRIARDAGDDEAFVIGGAQIYALTLPVADRLYLTRVHADVEGDVRFPEVDWSRWRQVFRQDREADAKHEHPLSFVDYVRKG